VRCLDAGAVDYVTNPFSIREVLGRVRTLPRRTGSARPAMLKGADFETDLLTRKVQRGIESSNSPSRNSLSWST
jgi:DNA-binding response OmpR family regulator